MPSEICSHSEIEFWQLDVLGIWWPKFYGGSLFLFDRKVLRYFRKDGHNWRKKKDGKTVKEAHEKLKAGSIDVLHCYYAHGEENENFQRRTYWLLEEDFTHIVLVHYLEVKGCKQSFNRVKEEFMQLSNVDSPSCSNSITSQNQMGPQNMEADESPISGQISEYEDTESADNCRASSRYHPLAEMQQLVDGVITENMLYPSASTVDSRQGYHGEMLPITDNLDSRSFSHHDIARMLDGANIGLSDVSSTPFDSVPFNEPFTNYSAGFREPTLHSSFACLEANNLDDSSCLQTFTSEALYTNHLSQKEADALGFTGILTSEVNGDRYNDDSIKHPLLKQSSLDLLTIETPGLKKHDSFSRWMSKELEEVVDLGIKSTSDAFWSSIETVKVPDGSNVLSNEQLGAYVVSPSLSQDQLFSILDVSPSCAYIGTNTKVSVTGTFLVNKEHVENQKWSCMFGDVEVPAEVLTDGTLRCYAPAHQSGRVPFYVTCSNRVACSEVREFEYRDSDAQYMETSRSQANGVNEMHLHIRLEKLLTLGPDDHHMLAISSGNEKYEIVNAINALMLDGKWSNQESSVKEVVSTARGQSIKKLVKEKLHQWLICKVNDDGKGPNVLCKEGQGVIHLVAALDYDWAIRPIMVAGVNVNFRDAHGWTALHWAASLGRERTVSVLIANGAAAGALTDPTSEFPSGRSPADLASVNGHKGIAGFLAESALTSHLSALTIRESNDSTVEVCGLPVAEDLTGTDSAQLAGEGPHAESLEGSLSAVRKSTQAAARIFQAFRVESFHRKKVVEYGDDDCGLSDERTLSLVSLKNVKPGQHDTHLHSAAVRIQNKFRGWKGRKEFMIIRQRIVKLQAHVRGHQVRKNYRKVVWSVGIVEKVILRWRRKRPGLRNFQPQKQLEGPSQIQPAKAEDEYDFLHDGRRQAEARLQRALARVHSMSQYPEAREQYHRLTTCVAEMKQSRMMQDEMLSEAAGGGVDDFMAGLEDLICIDDAAMSAIW
ncbi:calmodulin-binding transcription activator 3 isoform X3 [Sorghum bicolor]|uniref:calmodulin-binding transcription activator 3 isoform X3 n=1 Tax=Sorghum bicolor TaxID=4558 RepID=UPI000B425BDF|nr:calmodulin-binding transcription activator 3 isoform X3 [Sorghum bicolor]|eukprot:XP_021316766.1 calmodulin-binding transcription activator 3 isoform X3 [Sorghum bicolor]